MTNAINGFQKAGIWPVNRNVFSKADFLAAETTDVIFSETTPVADNCDMIVTSQLHASPSHPSVISSHPLATNTQITTFSSYLNAYNSHKMVFMSQSPYCSSTMSTSSSLLTASTSNPNTTSFQKSPRFIIPVPKQGLLKRLSRQREKTAILTSSPYKALLLDTLSKNVPTASKKREKTQNDKQKWFCIRKRENADADGQNTSASKKRKKSEENTPCL